MVFLNIYPTNHESVRDWYVLSQSAALSYSFGRILQGRRNRGTEGPFRTQTSDVARATYCDDTSCHK